MRWIYAFIALMTPTLPAAAAPTTNPVAAEAERALTLVRQTSYEHTIEINVSAGIFRTDCSGFIEFVLQQSAPASLAAVEKPKAHHRPLAEDFYQTFLDAPMTPEPARA